MWMWKSFSLALLSLFLFSSCGHIVKKHPYNYDYHPSNYSPSHSPSVGYHPSTHNGNPLESLFSYPAVTAAERALIRAVEKVGGESILGYFDPRICKVARRYAHKMAAQRDQDNHKGFEKRRSEIGGAAKEITAESWGIESTLQDHADECVESWINHGTSGHRAGIMDPNERYCFTMAKGDNGKYYCTGLFKGSGKSNNRESTSTTDTGSKDTPHTRPQTHHYPVRHLP